MAQHSKNKLVEWLGEDFNKPDVETAFNLVCNAAIMVEACIGFTIAIDKIALYINHSHWLCGDFKMPTRLYLDCNS